MTAVALILVGLGTILVASSIFGGSVIATFDAILTDTPLSKTSPKKQNYDPTATPPSAVPL